MAAAPAMAVPAVEHERAAAAVTEARLCEALGVPADAERVVVFCETSHWDPGWLLTSREYYRSVVERTLQRVVEELERDPRRVYGLECVFFLRALWDARPDLHQRVRRLMVERRLRMFGCGMTTPDTVVAHPEAIVRDYLAGQEWLRAQGLPDEPRVAYLPDSFGHSPALPSLLTALGIEAVALARVDGMYYPGTDVRSARRFPVPGSTAATLERELGAADVIWRDAAGSSVQCHWMPFGYGMGDLLAHRGLTRWMGLPLAFPARGARHVSRRIEAFAARLAPLARTRYVLCPIGFDFAPPIGDLVGLLERHNRGRYLDSGVFAVNAGLDDYAALVGCHEAALPVVALDPNPCFMGVATSRPELKRAYHRLVERLLAADAVAAATPPDTAARAELRRAWDQACMANHHDFVTGTSTDRVVAREQMPLLTELSAALEPLLPEVTSTARPRRRPLGARRAGRLLEIVTPHWELGIDPQAGATVSWWFDRARGVPLVGPGSLDVIAYRDDGGLWRMGHELCGGAWVPVDRSSFREARVEVEERDGVVVVRAALTVRGKAVIRELRLRSDGVVGLRVRAEAPRRHTLTLGLVGARDGVRLRAEVPGGVVERPVQRSVTPTFWPTGTVVLEDGAGGGLAFGSVAPAAVAVDEAGSVEWVVRRNAPRERAFGFLPLVAFPVAGRQDGAAVAEAALWSCAAGPDSWPSVAARAAAHRHDVLLGAELAARRRALYACTMDSADVEVMAIKPAWRGPGVIVRVRAHRVGGTAYVRLPGRRCGRAWLCDARERDLRPLLIVDGAAAVPLRAAITTVRLFEE